jgi:hypothetical protein
LVWQFFTRGTFSNKIQQFRSQTAVLILTDPRVETKAVILALYTNITVISICDVDSSYNNIDCAFPVTIPSVHHHHQRFFGAQDPPHEMYQFQIHGFATTLKYLLLGLKKTGKRGEG